MYSNLIKNLDNIQSTIHFNFIQGPKVEIVSPVSAEYLVEFYNDKQQLLHSSIIKNNHWTKCLYEYFINWNIKVYQKENDVFSLVEDYNYNAENKKVYIAVDSKALGDTLAWFPYVEEFRKKHKCQIICSTFHNHFFKSQYPDIEFIEPGKPAHGIYAMYQIGWYYNEDKDEINPFKHPIHFRSQEMQKTASDILGLEFKEISPKLPVYSTSKQKQVAIAIHSTSQAKYWNNKNGWQEVVDWLKDKGYKVVLLSREGDSYMGNYHPKGIEYLSSYDMDNTIKTLNESEAFIGISSGLSWLSWATNTPTIIISGFTEAYTEPASCYRLASAEGKCSGCFNSHKLDAGDWNWCPIHKGTKRQFECSKSITSKQVIEFLKEILVVS